MRQGLSRRLRGMELHKVNEVSEYEFRLGSHIQ
jgi:hypothetical protein